MNILFNVNYNNINFTGKKVSKNIDKIILAELEKSKNSIVRKDGILCFPDKFNYTEEEQIFKEFEQRYKILSEDVFEAKYDINSYHARTGKCDYNDIRGQLTSLKRKMNSFLKKIGESVESLQYSVQFKQGYNRYAPKIERATTHEELFQLENTIKNSYILFDAKQALYVLIDSKINRLSK